MPFIFILGLILVLFSGLHFATRGPAHCKPSELTNEDTAETIRIKCGKPETINASSYGAQWVYSKGFPFFGNPYIYLDEKGHFRSAQWEE